jgi:uncharacterized coiled-coil DUF342 family protein
MSNIAILSGVAGLSGLGYFTEIEMLHNKITELQQKLVEQREKFDEERAEFRDIYQRLREERITPTVYEELYHLKKENAKMAAELEEYHKVEAAQILQSFVRRCFAQSQS